MMMRVDTCVSERILTCGRRGACSLLGARPPGTRAQRKAMPDIGSSWIHARLVLESLGITTLFGSLRGRQRRAGRGGFRLKPPSGGAKSGRLEPQH